MGKAVTRLQSNSVTAHEVNNTIISLVKRIAHEHKRILVVLDSLHTGENVLKVCAAYGDLVSKDSYLVVMDTVTDMVYGKLENKELPSHLDRPWNKDDNPMTGMMKYLENNPQFEYDESFDKLLISSNPRGYLKRIA